LLTPLIFVVLMCRVLRIDPVLTWRALKLDRDIIDLPLLIDFMPLLPIERMLLPPIERMPPPPPIERMPPPPIPPRPKASAVSTITSEPAISANAPAASTVAILFMMKRSLQEGSMRPSDQKNRIVLHGLRGQTCIASE
jgi:hypothetical protein